jgi:hypothetical protein
VIEVLRRWGVDDAELTQVFEQLDTSDDAVVRM